MATSTLNSVPMSRFLDVDDDDDDFSMISGSVGRFTSSAASSATSVDWDMRSVSPTPSIYSVTSSIRAASFKLEYGRGLNNYSEVYQLPADDEELERLDKQHLMFIEVMGKYPPPIAEVLADDIPGEPKAIVDLGCGSGSWIVDVARDFPHCSAVAVDLVPMQALNMPPNCRSEVDDINLGLQHYYGDFNVTHARLVSSGIRDYASLVDHAVQTLRVGGLLDLMEFDFRVYAADKKPFVVTSNMQAPWLPRWMATVREAVEFRGGQPDAANHLHEWVSNNPFTRDIVYREFWIPTAPWRVGNDAETKRFNAIGEVMREDIYAFMKSGRPLLLGSGVPEETVNELERNAYLELSEARTPAYIRVESVYARRRL